MKGVAEFRARYRLPKKSNRERDGHSFRKLRWWIAATVLTLGVLAAPRAALRFGPAPDFGSPPVGSRSSESFVSMRNSGLGSLTISDVRIVGVDAGDFSPRTSDCTNGAVAPGHGCLFGIVFAPREEGRRVADLVVTSDDLLMPAHFVLSGTAATRADFRVVPIAIAFGDRQVGAVSEEKATHITNVTSTPVRIRDPQITNDAMGEFELGGNTCTDPLPKGGTCAIGVSFHPHVPGQRTGQLKFLDDNGDAPHEITLSGRGTAGDLTLEPEQISFPSMPVGQRSEPELLRVRNSGTGDVHMGVPALAGVTAGDFAVFDRSSCESVVLPAGAGCELRVQFEPKVTGSRRATLSLGDDAPDGPHAIELVGTGTEVVKPSAQIYAKTYSFGGQPVHTTSKPIQVWVASRGKAPLTIGTVDFQGLRSKEFGLKTNCSQRTLAQNDRCEIDVYFSPSAAGNEQIQILVPHDAPDAPTYFRVDGIGIDEERGWCCLGGEILETAANTCKVRGGRLFPDASAARSQCSHPTVPQPAPQAEVPTGLEPGTPSLSGNRPIACESVTLHWSPTPAPGGYLVSVARLQPGTDTAPRVVFSQDVFTNSYKVPSLLEAGAYEWSVTSLGQPGERNAAARPNYFLCASRVNVTERPKLAPLANSKAKAAISAISPPIQ